MNYLTSSNLLPPLQSGFRPGHSNRISRFTRAVRCPVSSRLWRFCCVGFARPISSFRYGELQHTSTAPADKLRHKRFSSAVVSVVPSWSNSTCPPGCHYIVGRSCRMWRSSGICDWSDFVRPLHGWPNSANCTCQELWVVTTSARWWHSDLWLLLFITRGTYSW